MYQMDAKKESNVEMFKSRSLFCTKKRKILIDHPEQAQSMGIDLTTQVESKKIILNTGDCVDFLDLM
jgi:hypothetical protein